MRCEISSSDKKSSASNLENWHVATLYPDTASEGKDWNSIIKSLESGSNTVAEDFEINDISILYRVRPIK